jgi:thiol-disulfide isomerase/thioredoxin
MKKDFYFFRSEMIERNENNMFAWFKNMKMEYRILLVVLAILILFALLFPRSTVYSYTYNYPMGAKDHFANDVEDEKKEEFSNTNEPTLVLFKVQWCGYCQKFLPEWMKFSKESPIRTMIVDCEEMPDIGKKYNIQGYPQVKFFPKGTTSTEMIDYNGERSAAALKDFVRSMASGMKESFEDEESIKMVDQFAEMKDQQKEDEKKEAEMETFANELEKRDRVPGAPGTLPNHASAYPFSSS